MLLEIYPKVFDGYVKTKIERYTKAVRRPCWIHFFLVYIYISISIWSNCNISPGFP